MSKGTVIINVTIPIVWPPSAMLKLHSGIIDGSTLEISAMPSGRLSFDVRFEKDQIHYQTPRLLLPDFASIKVGFSWGTSEGINCAINGKIVSGSATVEPVTIVATSHPPTGFRKQFNFAIPQGCNDVEGTFLRFTLELQLRVATSDRVNLLQASAMLRRMLLDANPIVHIVNRVYKQKLRFPFVEEQHTKAASGGSAFQFSNLCPEFADPAEIQMLRMDEFLAKPVLSDQKDSFTVHDVISVCANVKGGIHFGQPKSQIEESLIKLDRNYLPFFVDASLATLPGIAWTTINGTRSLRDAILGSKTHTSGTGHGFQAQ